MKTFYYFTLVLHVVISTVFFLYGTMLAFEYGPNYFADTPTTGFLCMVAALYLFGNFRRRDSLSTEQAATVQPTEQYDDLLPVSLYENKSGSVLLDRHNDLIATFDDSVELIDRERLVEYINAHLQQ